MHQTIPSFLFRSFRFLPSTFQREQYISTKASQTCDTSSRFTLCSQCPVGSSFCSGQCIVVYASPTAVCLTSASRTKDRHFVGVQALLLAPSEVLVLFWNSICSFFFSSDLALRKKRAQPIRGTILELRSFGDVRWSLCPVWVMLEV